MSSRDMEDLEGPAKLLSLLEASNLMSYKNALLEQGADDVDQLASLTDDEFMQLCSMIGMDKKPFHVMRLRKTLEKQSKISSSACILAPNSTPGSSKPTTEGPALPMKLSSKELDCQLFHEQSFLPPFLCSNSDSADFTALVDDETPIQLTLDPCFCTPGAWDPKRKTIIRKFSAIYPKGGLNHRLSLHEEHVNEAAYQLCLRDPTLLVRKDELIVLSKKAAGHGASSQQYTTPHAPVGRKPTERGTSSSVISPILPNRAENPGDDIGYSTSKVPVASKKRALEVECSSPDIPTALVSKHSHTDLTMRLTAKERASRMKTVCAEIEANKAFQNVKLIAIEEAREISDFSTSSALCENLKALRKELKELESSYSLLKRKQDRSEKYHKQKSSRGAGKRGSGSSQCNTLSPIEPITIDFEFESNTTLTGAGKLDSMEDSSPAEKPQGRILRATKRKTTTPKRLKLDSEQVTGPSSSKF